MAEVSRINIEGTPFYMRDRNYCICETAANTAAKTASLTGFVLTSGAIVQVKFTNSNTATSPTLNVNSTGAIPIKMYGTTAVGTTQAESWYAGAVLTLAYDGTNWVLANYTPSSGGGGSISVETTGSGNAVTSVEKDGDTLTVTKGSTFLTSHQTVKNDNISGATVNRFGTCSTAADTAAKTVSVTNGTVTLGAGLRVTVLFTYANTASSPTLNVNSKGAKNIFHKGSQITTGDNKSLLSGACDFVYDGTQWHLVGNYIDTTSSVSASTSGSGNAVTSITASGSALTVTKGSTFLTSHQSVVQDGITGATVTRFGTCSTAAATAAKTVSVTNGTVTLGTGLRVTVKFSYANTASSPTLNVNSKGAKNIYHKGSRITTGTNKSLLAGVCDFVYDGTQWHLVGNYIEGSSSGDVSDVQVLKVTASSVSSLSKTISNSKITSSHEVIGYYLSNPSAQTGDWTITTSTGSLTIAGTISGTTNITLYLAKPTT